MRKKKMHTPVRTRKQRALRRLMLLLLVLAVVSWLFPAVNLTPRQAIRRGEERAGARSTAVVTWQRVPDANRGLLACLTANDSGVVLGFTRVSLLGWEVFQGMELPCDGDEPVYAQRHILSYAGEEIQSVDGFFGRVDDPAILRLEVSLRTPVAWDENGRPARWEELGCIPFEEDTWHTLDGHRYFLALTPKLQFVEDPHAECFLLGYDANDQLVQELWVQRLSGIGFGS